MRLLQSKSLLCLIFFALASIVALDFLHTSTDDIVLPHGFEAPASARSLIVEYQQPDGAETLIGNGLVVVHLWATWCAPCIEELPELDHYMAQQPAIPVVPLALDGPQHAQKVVQFIQDYQLEHIPANVASFAKIKRSLNVNSLPATIILQKRREIGRKEGVVDWPVFRLDGLDEAALK